MVPLRSTTLHPTMLVYHRTTLQPMLDRGTADTTSRPFRLVAEGREGQRTN